MPLSPEEQEKINAEFARFRTPKDRIEFLKEKGVEYHFLISEPELRAIQDGTDKLNGEIRKWRILAQAVHGTTSPEAALEQHQKQAKHRQKMAQDVIDFRRALMDIIAMAPNSAQAVRARKAINHED